jgi:hypothetical protein
MKNKDKLYWFELTFEINNLGIGHDHNDLTKLDNLSLFCLPLFSS